VGYGRCARTREGVGGDEWGGGLVGGGVVADRWGVFLCLGAAGGEGSGAVGGEGESRGCCSAQDAADARRVAERLGIELFVLDFSDAFSAIVDNFASEYAAGRTPNPCIHCNCLIKFGRLIERADSLGMRYVVTGHHARVVRKKAPAPFFGGVQEKGSGAFFGADAHIARGRARGKDQSYALFAVARENIGRMLLPIGELADKARVREIALGLGLNVHDKPDSQEICFVGDDDYVALLRRRRPDAMRPGAIVMAGGEVVGEHDGYGQFTIGQRRGLRVAAGEPMYVTRIDPATATVTIGPRGESQSDFLRASCANWHCQPPAEFDATVQIRYNHAGSPGRVRITGPDTFEVHFASPVHAITPGQAAVVYEGDRLLGGGWIDLTAGEQD